MKTNTNAYNDTKVATRAKIKTYKIGQKNVLAKIYATELIQELPPVLKSIDRMYWLIDRLSINRILVRSIESLKLCKTRNRNRNRIEILPFFFFFGTNQKLIDSNMKHKTTQKN
jgi:hypothetical protein